MLDFGGTHPSIYRDGVERHEYPTKIILVNNVLARFIKFKNHRKFYSFDNSNIVSQR